MSDIVIRAENLGKSYIIGHEKQERYIALRDVLANKVKQIAGKTRQIFHGGQLIAGNELEEFWALKDINFEIKQGDRLGIIGRNGAGKSTLLKVLSRITEPTTGRIQINGRVASLLEVGTGFHPELSGRENIYLNGAILGMSRIEIKKKFDEIVDFSGVEKFLDTPVKRYSSGMYVRLAFAVAAHLEPEILVVDEVLSVGDAEFQKKSIGKMQDVAKQGRTVLFVSHNMAAISALCERTIVLKSGKISFDGNVGNGIDHYLGFAEHVTGFVDLQNKKSNLLQPHNFFSKLLSIETLDKNNQRQSLFRMGGCLNIKVSLEIKDDRKDIELLIAICNSRETILGVLLSKAEGFMNIQKGINDIQIDIPEINLVPGGYSLAIGIIHQQQADDSHVNAIVIDIVSDNFTGNYVDYNRFKEYGSIIRSNWKNCKPENNTTLK